MLSDNNEIAKRQLEPEMLSNSGLTEQQWRILRVLEELGPLDSTKLSENASLLLPSQTRIVQTLVEKGLVTRQADPSDRRRQTVAFFEKAELEGSETLRFVLGHDFPALLPALRASPSEESPAAALSAPLSPPLHPPI